MSNLPPGYRFFPTEEELVGFYLRCKLDRKRDDLDRVIPVLDIYSLDPWQLPSFSGELCIGDEEQWFFFSPRQEREAHGGRPNRITPSGYWKATGIPGYVFSSENRIIGLKRTMVFYEGKAPKGRKTKWKVNEYKAIEEATTSANSSPKVRHEINLCRVYITSGNLRSFDRRPLVTGTGMMLDGEEYEGAMTGINFCNNEGTNDRNRGESSHANATMEEQACVYPRSSPREGTGNALTMINDLEFFWDSLIQDRMQ